MVLASCYFGRCSRPFVILILMELPNRDNNTECQQYLTDIQKHLSDHEALRHFNLVSAKILIALETLLIAGIICFVVKFRISKMT